MIVPNGQLAGATITNFDEPSRLHRVVVSLQVAYANAPTRAAEMLLATARATPGVLDTPEPAVSIVQIDDPLMGYEVHMWSDDYTIAPSVRSDFGSLVWYYSHRFDVPLPSPAQDLHLWDGQRTAAQGIRDRASLTAGLGRSPLLDQLTTGELDMLGDSAKALRFAAGETILSHGDGHLVMVEHGRARLEVLDPNGRIQPVADITDGDLVGVLGLDPPPGCTISVAALTDCDVIELEPDAAGQVISQSPELNAALEQLTTSRGRRIRRTLRRIAGRRALTTGTGPGPSGDSVTEPPPDTATPGTGGVS